MQESSTFRTFAGNISLLKITQPLWAILENVDMGQGDVSESDSNVGMIHRALDQAGYEMRALALQICVNTGSTSQTSQTQTSQTIHVSYDMYSFLLKH